LTTAMRIRMMKTSHKRRKRLQMMTKKISKKMKMKKVMEKPRKRSLQHPS